MDLRILDGSYSICRVDSTDDWKWDREDTLQMVVRHRRTSSVVCETTKVPVGVEADNAWSAIEVVGCLPLSMTGVLSSIASPLSKKKIPIFVISTFDTDLILVKTENLLAACQALEHRGFSVGGRESIRGGGGSNGVNR